MNTIFYDGIFLMCNAFDTYVLYLFMQCFFKNKYTDKKGALALYGIYWLISGLIYLFLSNFTLNLASSVLLVFMLTVGYRSKISTKIIATILGVLTFLTAEIIVAVLIGIANIQLTDHIYHGSKLTLLIVSLFKYALVKIIGKFQHLNQDIQIPKRFLLATVLTSVFSIFLEMQLLTQKGLNSGVYFTSLVCVILLNFTLFYLYDSMGKLLTEKARSAVAEQKNAYYQKEAELIQKNSAEVKKLRHDMKNHLIVIAELAKVNENQEMLDYIAHLSKQLQAVDQFSSTGIFFVDSIINYKLTQATQRGISVSSQIVLPNSLKIDANDFVTVIGNLLDNAIDATSKLTRNRYIRLNINYAKGTTIITVKNSFDGNIRQIDDTYQTTKKDKKLHSIGLQSVKTIIQKYHGEMITHHNDTEFTVKILLFL